MPPLSRLLPVLIASLAFAKDPFAEGVRTTEPLTPEEQQKTFKLPPGFEIQLVAAEPDLRKPMNMAFDVQGRLWVAESREYPFPVKPGEPARDSIRIFSDFAPDGRARKMERFADNLNIPIGVYPFRSPGAGGRVTQKCIAWSIPNIWLFEDTDGDGKADQRQVLFGPLGWEKDTHGNLASFRRGNDGWLYGTHGFSNHSIFKAKDGSSIDLQSGNTWRVQIDGSRVEQHTWGQVNPFGLCWDARGNLYSADCHSSPLYQLLRGGYYPSFGKPHDGLGFAPITLQHSHGSTAICGPVMVEDASWPENLQQHIFIGNVMTSRLNHDAIEWRGSSSKGKEQPDFLTTTDPWFRPVDLQWGPDGALYIADFYNRIIGHYEVPLTHPGRDRERGRIWRIVYRGGDGKAPLRQPALPNSITGLVEELGSGNPARRSLALNALCDEFGPHAKPALQNAFTNPANGYQKITAAWALKRIGSLSLDGLLACAADADADALVRIHTWRILDQEVAWTPQVYEAARRALSDSDSFVRRCAVEALGTHPKPDNVRPLLDLLRGTDKEDDHLIHSIRMALRDHFRAPGVAATVSLDGLEKSDMQAVLDVMLAVMGPETAMTRLRLFEKLEIPIAELSKQLPSIALNVPAPEMERVAALARTRLENHPVVQATLLTNILSALDQRGAPPGKELVALAKSLAPRLLDSNAATGWTAISEGKSPWALQKRKRAGGKELDVISSFPGGETLTGSLRSAPFILPEKLEFYLCGHDGVPDKPPGKRNSIRLIDSTDGKVLREAVSPRNDVAQKVTWDLREFSGKRGVFEAVDGDSAPAYAWIAFGKFNPELPELPVVEPGGTDQQRLLGLNLVARFQLADCADATAKLLRETSASTEVRTAASAALMRISPEGGIAQICAAMKEASTPLQAAFARTLCSTQAGASALLKATGEGHASPALFRDPALVAAIKATGLPNATDTLAGLTATLPPANAEADKLIASRRQSFQTSPGNASKGAQVFAAHCAACHRIGSTGNLVGPQLDGIGSRGLERILEDVLDPNRNVDRAFRLSTVTMKDGSVASGLVRREEGAVLVVADFTGKEVAIPREQIARRQESDTSLMPPVFGQSIQQPDFNDLIAYLASQRATH